MKLLIIHSVNVVSQNSQPRFISVTMYRKFRTCGMSLRVNQSNFWHHLAGSV